MDPVSVTSLLAFGKDAIEVIDKIYDLFKAIREAPKKLKNLLTELFLLRKTLGTIRDVCSQIELANERIFLSVKECCEEALSFVRHQAQCLYSELSEFNIPEAKNRWRTWRMSLRMVLADEKIIEHMHALERGKSLLTAAQASLQIHLITRQTRQIEASAQKMDEMIKLDSAIASYCLAQAKLQTVPRERDNLGTTDMLPAVLPTSNCHSLLSPSIGARQCNPIEVKPIIAAQSVPQPRSALAKTQLLPPLSTLAAGGVLQQDHKSLLETSDESDKSNMAMHHGHQADLLQRYQSSPRHSSSLIPHTHYSQGQVSKDNVTYLRTWLGTITLTQKTSVSHMLNCDDEELNSDQVYERTAIQFTPAPWLSKTAYVLTLQKELIYATSSHLGIALQPVRYTAIPQPAFHALRHGDLASIQRMLAAGQLSLHDREVGKGQSLSLLDLSINAIGWVWLFNEGAVYSDRRVGMMDVIRTVRWIFNRGTSADTQCQDAVLPSSFDFGNMRGSYLIDEIEQMEQLLVEISEHESPLSRGQRLLSFAISNPEHSLYVDCVISNITMEGFTDEDFLSIAKAEERFWAKGSTLDMGQEAVIFHAMMRSRREFQLRAPKKIPEAVIRRILKGPRRLLFDMLKAAIDAQTSTQEERIRWTTDAVDYASSLLRACRDLPLLEGGFGGLLSAYASEHGIRDCWNAILSNSTGYSDGIGPEVLGLDLNASIALFIRLDSEVTVLQLGESETKMNSPPSEAATILSCVWALFVFLLRSLV